MLTAMSKLTLNLSAYYWFDFTKPQAAGEGKVRAT